MPSPSSVLVSGAEAHATAVADALRTRGVTVTEVHDLADLAAVCGDAGTGAFESYVQLPAKFEMHGNGAIERVYHFYAKGVLARFPALAATLPTLTDPARVVFVLGQLPPEAATVDDRDARRALTRVLTHAARADRPGDRLLVRVLDASAGADEIALAALGRSPDRELLLEQLSDVSYADWRVEVLGLAALET